MVHLHSELSHPLYSACSVYNLPAYRSCESRLPIKCSLIALYSLSAMPMTLLHNTWLSTEHWRSCYQQSLHWCAAAAGLYHSIGESPALLFRAWSWKFIFCRTFEMTVTWLTILLTLTRASPSPDDFSNKSLMINLEGFTPFPLIYFLILWGTCLRPSRHICEKAMSKNAEKCCALRFDEHAPL